MTVFLATGFVGGGRRLPLGPGRLVLPPHRRSGADLPVVGERSWATAARAGEGARVLAGDPQAPARRGAGGGDRRPARVPRGGGAARRLLRPVPVVGRGAGDGGRRAWPSGPTPSSTPSSPGCPPTGPAARWPAPSTASRTNWARPVTAFAYPNGGPGRPGRSPRCASSTRPGSASASPSCPARSRAGARPPLAAHPAPGVRAPRRLPGALRRQGPGPAAPAAGGAMTGAGGAWPGCAPPWPTALPALVRPRGPPGLRSPGPEAHAWSFQFDADGRDGLGPPAPGGEDPPLGGGAHAGGGPGRRPPGGHPAGARHPGGAGRRGGGSRRPRPGGGRPGGLPARSQRRGHRAAGGGAAALPSRLVAGRRGAAGRGAAARRAGAAPLSRPGGRRRRRAASTARRWPRELEAGGAPGGPVPRRQPLAGPGRGGPGAPRRPGGRSGRPTATSTWPTCWSPPTAGWPSWTPTWSPARCWRTPPSCSPTCGCAGPGR